MVQWLQLGPFTAMAPGSIPGQGTKILQAPQRGQKKKKDFGTSPVFNMSIFLMKDKDIGEMILFFFNIFIGV